MHVFDILKYAAIGFNRYMVECESKPGRVVPSRFSVLIDTWWNVNQTTGISADPTASFNRYMVECELIRITTWLHSCLSFNRYMVECE